MTTPAIHIFTDGAAKGNPGPGGWGAIIHDGTTVTELGGAAALTTNNRMEMEAVIHSLDTLRTSAAQIIVHSDSAYVIQGITQWIHGWKKRGWKTAQGGDVLNRDLWERLDTLARAHRGRLRWVQVPGHAGVPGNERADGIASDFALGTDVQLYRGAASAYPIDILDTAPAVGAAPRASRKKTSARSGAAYSYLSLIGGVVERHRTWPECERRVRGVSGARYKKAMSPQEEKEILTAWGMGR